MKPIAHIHTDLPQKFGIPRNSFLAPHLQGRIVFEPEYALNSAVAGIDSFSHLWLLWRFENGEPGGGAADVAGARAAAAAGERAPAPVAASPKPARWSPTVRPPRLGGAERVGVFATRSPFRPNPIGLTCVKLDRVELTDAGPVIHVLGADLRDGTPIYDIKPYIPYADCHPDAQAGFTAQLDERMVTVECPPELLQKVPAETRDALLAVLSHDPRPSYQHDPERVYGMAFAGWNVRFRVQDKTLTVCEVEPIQT